MEQAYFQDITPAIAKAYLETSPIESRRKIRKSHVDYIARDLQSGHWTVSHQGIAFNKHGRLIDGHHRLSAIVQSDKTVKCLVTTGLEDDALPQIDTGIIVRPVGDAFKFLGKNPVSFEASAAIKAMFNAVAPKLIGSKQLEYKLVEKYLDDVNFVLDMFPKNKGIRAASKAPITRAYINVKNDVEKINKLRDFCEAFTNGGTAEHHRVINALRNYLSPPGFRGHRGGALGAKTTYMVTEKALIQFLNREPYKRLQYTPDTFVEAFPLPEDEEF